MFPLELPGLTHNSTCISIGKRLLEVLQEEKRNLKIIQRFQTYSVEGWRLHSSKLHLA